MSRAAWAASRRGRSDTQQAAQRSQAAPRSRSLSVPIDDSSSDEEDDDESGDDESGDSEVDDEGSDDSGIEVVYDEVKMRRQLVRSLRNHHTRAPIQSHSL